MQVEPFAALSPEGLRLRLYVQPGAARSALVGLRLEQNGDRTVQRLKISLQARAVEGAANQALINFLAQICGCPKSSISLTGGQTSRNKSVLIAAAAEDLETRLRALIKD